MTELAAFIFIRTRTSIKYFPKLVTLANLLFLYYINSTMYSCQFEALNFLQTFTATMFFYFLNNFEYEAVNNWNPFGAWTPSEYNPRCGYHHVLLDSHYGIGFDIFSLGMPL